MRFSFPDKLVTMPCREEDRQPRCPNVQLSRKIDAAQSRHDDIGEDEIERLLLEKRKCFSRVARAHRLAAQIVQQLLGKLENLNIIFDQEDPDTARYGGQFAFILDSRWHLVDLGKDDGEGSARSDAGTYLGDAAGLRREAMDLGQTQSGLGSAAQRDAPVRLDDRKRLSRTDTVCRRGQDHRPTAPHLPDPDEHPI